MNCLFIDTASSKRVIAITSDNKLIHILNEDNGLDLSSSMLPLISDAFDKTHLSINDIDKIFVVIGPGSFTGIRVGVTIAKTIAWALKIDIVPISELELMASGEEGIIIPLIDARRGYVYSGIYENGVNLFKDRHILFNDILIEAKKYNNVRLVSYDNFEKINCYYPDIDILKIIERHKNDVSINPHLINPVYLKNTEAEEKLKANG